MNENIIGELNQKIMALDQTINELRNQLGKESLELNAINNEYLSLKSQYDLKKLELSNDQRKLNEKLQILSEARKSYEKIVFNTTKLIDVLNNELSNN